VGETVSLLVVCTGNASRSVMAGEMLRHLATRRGAPLSVVTAGTHALDGLPLGARTVRALCAVPALAAPPVTTHRSRQLAADDLRRADLVVVMETAHVRYVRRLDPDAAPRTGLLRALARDLPPGAPETLGARVVSLGLEHAALDPGDDVADPAGGDDAAYVACAAALWQLCSELDRRL
jgi:protein-tyrosine phosphatase